MKKIVTTVSLGEKELQLLERLAADKSMTKSNVIAHALRVLSTLEQKLQSGSKVYLEDGAKNKAELMIV